MSTYRKTRSRKYNYRSKTLDIGFCDSLQWQYGIQLFILSLALFAYQSPTIIQSLIPQDAQLLLMWVWMNWTDEWVWCGYFQFLPIPTTITNLPGRTSTAQMQLLFKAILPPLGFNTYYFQIKSESFVFFSLTYFSF